MNEVPHQMGALALHFINYTHRNVFLTGGAGTGKTTFLRFLKSITHKKIVIAAPTGVAAINAGGTTIHSLFGLPPRFLDEATVKIIRLAAPVKALLRDIELLVVDEASMLRADVLDAMDYLLRDVRQKAQPFGGLQVLFIGDLFQLPPVETQQDTEKRQGLYPSFYFTDAKVFPELDMLHLEMTDVYRQSDPAFIKLLNTIRTGRLTSEDLNHLNKLYCPDWTEKNTLILTTHKRYASQLNEQQLSGLPGPAYNLVAEITGEFGEDQYPVDKVLQLKRGCRVMIIKNDNSNNPQFFNGKIGVVISINDRAINVKFEDGSEMPFERETWPNISYASKGENDSFSEQVVGTFRQFPLRLAWAITVHKSQGLTFEKVVIDVADAFAPGQVYVALSRVRSLQGVCLKSKIPASAIIRPPVTKTALLAADDLNALMIELQNEKKTYTQDFLLNIFDWGDIRLSINSAALPEQIQLTLAKVVEKLARHASNFSTEIKERLGVLGAPDWTGLVERLKQAEAYFVQEINGNCIGPLKEFVKKNKDDFKFRGQVNVVKTHIKTYQQKASALAVAKQVVHGVMGRLIYSPFGMEQPAPRVGKIPNTKESVVEQSALTSTEVQSLQLFQAGKTIAEIAALRSLGVPAIEYHLASFIPTGEIQLADIIPQQILDDVLPQMKGMKAPSIAQLRPVTGGRLSMGQLQALSVYLSHKLS